MTSSEQAVLKTLIYADLFNYSLTLEEIQRYLISTPETPGVKAVSTPGVKAIISQLIHSQQISTLASFYFLPGKKKLVTLRLQRKAISQAKLKRAQSLANLIAKFPSIQGIFLTGALAMENAGKTDDIDLLIITKANTLWTTRLLVNLTTDVFNLRRRPKQRETQVTDKICLNLWLDESALAIPKHKRNLYTAHEVAQVKPLVNKNYTHERFLAANQWIRSYLPNSPLPPTPGVRAVSTPGVSWLNTLSFFFQRQYMKRKMTRETISLYSAFFHPYPNETKVLTKYSDQMKLFLNHKSKI
jgi:D-beta-D-heptose 7-phosphate kinase/D-beta-D-heptose 1-phosphate adenosyltransferase